MLSNIDSPFVVSYGVILEDLAKMASITGHCYKRKERKGLEIGSLRFQSVSRDGTNGCDTIADSHRYGISGVVNMGNVMSRRLLIQGHNPIQLPTPGLGVFVLAGEGRCKRVAASFSPGASNATTGEPKVAPSREAIDPPRECPLQQL